MKINQSQIDKIQMIVIGCSAGGFEALKVILPSVPKIKNLSVVSVLHLTPNHESMLSDIFSKNYHLNAKEAEDKEKILPQMIYFAPPNYHLLIEPDKSFSLSVDEPINFSRPSIDVLFESAAATYQDQLLGIILTGANNDGALGLKAVVESGGMAIVEDPKTARQPSMPQAALEQAHPQMVMSLNEIKDWLSIIGERPSN